MTADQIKKAIIHFDRLLGEGSGNPQKSIVQTWLDARIKDDKTLVAARRRLIETGIPEERLLRFPAEQLLLLDEKREYDVRFDDIMKTLNVPAWQAAALAGRTTSGPGTVAVRRDPGLGHFRRPAQAGATRSADRAPATRRGPPNLRRGTRRRMARETRRCSSALARRSVHRPAIPLRSLRQHGAPPRQPTAGRREEPRVQRRPLRADPEEAMT